MLKATSLEFEFIKGGRGGHMNSLCPLEAPQNQG